MPITPHLFNAFLKCPTKCWLGAHGETPTGNVHDEWVQTQKESYRANEIMRLLSETPPDERAYSPCGSRGNEAHFSSETLKSAKWRLAVEVPARIRFRSRRGNEALILLGSWAAKNGF